MPPARLERATPGLGILCSIHLSYGGLMQTQLVVPFFADSIATDSPFREIDHMLGLLNIVLGH